MKNGAKSRKIPCWYARGTLGANLRRILDTHEQTKGYDNKAARLEDLTVRAGNKVSDSTINRMLSSETGADIDTIGHLALALKIPLSRFLADPATDAVEPPMQSRHVSAITEDGKAAHEGEHEARPKTRRKTKRHRQ